MKLNSINVGMPKEANWDGRSFITSIFKSPVNESWKVSFTNIDGDKQSDLKVHGGPTRAVSVYASEYYEFWKDVLKKDHLPWGYFGENLNISGGMFESEIMVGDRFSIGSVEFEALQPRLPCFKLAMKLGDNKWMKFFLDSRKTGFYFGVLKEGIIKPGDTVIKTYESKDSISIDDITNLYMINPDNEALLKKAITVERLTPSWKEHFSKQLKRIS